MCFPHLPSPSHLSPSCRRRLALTPPHLPPVLSSSTRDAGAGGRLRRRRSPACRRGKYSANVDAGATDDERPGNDAMVPPNVVVVRQRRRHIFLPIRPRLRRDAPTTLRCTASLALPPPITNPGVPPPPCGAPPRASGRPCRTRAGGGRMRAAVAEGRGAQLVGAQARLMGGGARLVGAQARLTRGGA
jgi:hypothetical protein